MTSRIADYSVRLSRAQLIECVDTSGLPDLKEPVAELRCIGCSASTPAELGVPDDWTRDDDGNYRCSDCETTDVYIPRMGDTPPPSRPMDSMQANPSPTPPRSARITISPRETLADAFDRAQRFSNLIHAPVEVATTDGVRVGSVSPSP
jgi:hypothetical protein